LKYKNPAAAVESFTRGLSVGQGQEKFVLYVQRKMAQYGLESRIDEVIQAAELKVNAKKAA
jgi:hypothetical protein